MDTKKPYLVVILIQCIYAGMYLLSKAAFEGGMNTYVFVFYRQAAATLFISPVAIISERKRAPPLSSMIILKIFLLALVGITFSLNVYSIALNYTSASVASATSNSVPVATFFLAVLMRMETIKLKSVSGAAKVLGITLCLTGVSIIAFYSGPSLSSPNHHHLGHGSSPASPQQSHSRASWIKGSFLLIASNTTWSLWIVFQGKVLKEYPSKLIFTALQCLFSAIQSFFVAVGFERRISAWKLGLDVGILAVAYCGIVVTGVSFYLQAWCIEKKGPVFLAFFCPLALVITLFFSFFVMGDSVSLGSVLGGLLMVGGLYSVLWGKRREQAAKIDEKLPIQEGKQCPEETTTTASPFHPL